MTIHGTLTLVALIALADPVQVFKMTTVDFVTQFTAVSNLQAAAKAASQDQYLAKVSRSLADFLQKIASSNTLHEKVTGP
jgi:hypothetical protein